MRITKAESPVSIANRWANLQSKNTSGYLRVLVPNPRGRNGPNTTLVYSIFNGYATRVAFEEGQTPLLATIQITELGWKEVRQ